MYIVVILTDNLQDLLHGVFKTHLDQYEYQSSHMGSAPSSTGKKHILRYLKGERLTQREAILAKCCDCCGHYIDGREDCQVPLCSLYPFMPYRGKS